MIHPRSLIPIALLGLVGACSANGTTNGGDGASGSGTVSTAGGAATNNGGASTGSGGSNTQSGGQGQSSGGQTATGGQTAMGGLSSSGGTPGAGSGNGGAPGGGGAPGNGGAANNGGSSAAGANSNGGSTSNAGTTGAGGGAGAGAGGTSCTGPVGTIAGALATGIAFTDTDGKTVDAHGGGIIQVGDTFYMHGEYFLPGSTTDDFNGFSMYSSKDFVTWKNEGIILPQQPACTGTQSPTCGALGPVTKGERPHIIKCPSTGEYVLYAHAASEDYQTWKAVVYATSATVNGKYSYKGPLTNSGGTIAAHSDMSAYADSTGAYVVTESGHVYTLASDCHSWLSDKSFSAVNGDSGGSEAPTVFKAGSTYYWIGSYKTGWRANNNFYSTAPAITGPWTYQGFVAPVTDPTNDISDQRTWLTQTTWVQPVTGCNGTVYVYWGDHWYGDQDTTNPGKHNDQATYVFQPLVFSGTQISMPVYEASWKLNVGAGTWSQ